VISLQAEIFTKEQIWYWGLYLQLLSHRKEKYGNQENARIDFWALLRFLCFHSTLISERCTAAIHFVRDMLLQRSDCEISCGDCQTSNNTMTCRPTTNSGCFLYDVAGNTQFLSPLHLLCLMRQCALLSSMICVSNRSHGGHFVHLYIQYTRSLLENDLIVPTQSLLTAVSCSGGTCPYTRSPLENNSPMNLPGFTCSYIMLWWHLPTHRHYFFRHFHQHPECGQLLWAWVHLWSSGMMSAANFLLIYALCRRKLCSCCAHFRLGVLVAGGCSGFSGLHF